MHIALNVLFVSGFELVAVVPSLPYIEVDVFQLPHINAISNVRALKTNAVTDETSLVACTNEDIVEITLEQASYFDLRTLEEMHQLQVTSFPQCFSQGIFH